MRLRILTAAVLLGFVVPYALWSSISGFVVFAAAVLALCLWEWTGLLRLSTGPRLAASAFLMAWAVPLVNDPLFSPWHLFDWVLFPVCLVWLIMLPMALRRGRSPVGASGLVLAVFLSVGCLSAIWLARQEGLAFLLSIALLVWMADTAAYFSGRAFGRRKLAPSISPGKTWAGVGGAVVGNLVLVYAASEHWPGSWAWMLREDVGWGYLVGTTLLITAVAVMADLHQSLLKRQVQVKDSGRLLPGHGGFFDRLDALLAVLPFAVFFYSASI